MLDYEELTLITIFTNLHHKILLLVYSFSMILARSLPTLDPSCFPFFIRLLLLFFQKNQILSPDNFKPKLHTEFARKKRSHEEFMNQTEASPSISPFISKEKSSTPQPYSSISKASQKLAKGNKQNQLPRIGKRQSAQTQSSENIFCFIRKFMRNSSLELLNIYEVANQFLEKLSEINLNGNTSFKQIT